MRISKNRNMLDRAWSSIACAHSSRFPTVGRKPWLLRPSSVHVSQAIQSLPSRLVPRHLLALVFILLAAAFLRLTGVNWDQGHPPASRRAFLTMVAADIRMPGSLAAYFDTARSPLNPGNVGRPFFVYGTLPLFVVRSVAESVGMTSYGEIHLVGRVLSSVFDLVTIVLTFWLGLLVAGPRAATAAAALVAFCVLSVQQAHFFTVDSAATCLSTLTLVMIATLISRRGLHFHVLFGAAFGLALSCRINLVLLAAVYALALSVSMVRGTNATDGGCRRRDGGRRHNTLGLPGVSTIRVCRARISWSCLLR